MIYIHYIYITCVSLESYLVPPRKHTILVTLILRARSTLLHFHVNLILIPITNSNFLKGTDEKTKQLYLFGSSKLITYHLHTSIEMDFSFTFSVRNGYLCFAHTSKRPRYCIVGLKARDSGSLKTFLFILMNAE